MSNSSLKPLNRSNAVEQLRRMRLTWWLWFLLLMLLTAVIGWQMTRAGAKGPDGVFFAWLAYIAGGLLILYKPRYGIYLVIFFALAGDAELVPDYPFTKNFSSSESLFYINDNIIVSPAEVYLLLTIISWYVQGRLARTLDFFASELFWPAVALTAFVIFGMVNGLLLRGGDVNVGLWEARPIFYLPVMLVLAGNLLRKREHANNFMWAAMLGLLVKSIMGTSYFFFELNGDLTGVESITEHAAAIQMNTLILYAVAVWIFKGSWSKRVILLLFLPLVIIPYLATQRRAAFITLAISLALTVLILYRANRRAFWVLVPTAVLAGIVYTGVFWNSSSTIALPAQAVKSLISPTDVSDASSNFYRILENSNIAFTLHQSPITGVGFGKKFHAIVTMPDISFFEWWQYITHNSILWFWMKTGVFGFISLLVFIGMALMVGVRTIWRMPGGDLSAMAMVATLYVVVHFMYAYVDMSWDNQSMLYLGALLGMMTRLEQIVYAPEKRRLWRWRTPRRLVATPEPTHTYE